MQQQKQHPAKRGPKPRVHPECGQPWEAHEIKGRPVINRDGGEDMILSPQWRCP